MALMSKAEAKKAGKRAGLAAASWKFDGNTTKATYEYFLKGLADGDPEVLDAYMPPSWLSGEFAGESMNELIGAPDTPAQEARVDDVAQAYEDAAEGAYWHELERMARYAVGGRRGPRRFNPVRSGVRQRATVANPNPNARDIAMDLDDMEPDDLFKFWAKHQRGRGAKALFPDGGRGTREATANLAAYASNLGAAKRTRLSGDIQTAQMYERIAEGIYNKLPPLSGNPRRMARNPKVTVFHANPRRTGGRPILQSSRVYEIAYKHVKDGKAYKHPFKTGVCMELLPDGSIRIYSRTGKRLWKDFR